MTHSRLLPVVLAAALTASLAGCDRLRSAVGQMVNGDRPAPPPAATAPPDPPRPAVPMAAPMPDVGKVGSETVNAKGTGASAAEAIDEAMRLALKQVNGVSMDLASEQLKATFTLARGRDAEALRANVFAEQVVQSAGGAITGFKVNAIDGPDARGFYKADLEISVAKFKPAATDSRKLKIVVAPLRYDAPVFNVGGRAVPSAEVAQNLRQQILAALTDSGRFTVLDRDEGGAIAQELERIAEGQAPRAEIAKLGQAVSADVVWIGRIAGYAYDRHARALQTSNRELVSYSGGWSLSQKLVSVANRQVLLSDALRGEAPSRAPTTLDAGVDGARISDAMQHDIAARVVSTILMRTFPVTVIARDGSQVVLSQGGAAVREGARYRLVRMGKEMFDPQTGQSLGRMESDCCEVVIDRVTATMSQGRLERMQTQMPLDESFEPGSLQLREQVQGKAGGAVAEAPAAAAAPATARAQARRPAPGAAPSATPKSDDKW